MIPPRFNEKIIDKFKCDDFYLLIKFWKQDTLGELHTLHDLHELYGISKFNLFLRITLIRGRSYITYYVLCIEYVLS